MKGLVFGMTLEMEVAEALAVCQALEEAAEGSTHRPVGWAESGLLVSGPNRAEAGERVVV
jgi:hypothetical protein